MRATLCKYAFYFHGFFVQPSMISGYDIFGTPFVTNGVASSWIGGGKNDKRCNQFMLVRFYSGLDDFGQTVWSKPEKITKDECPTLFSIIERKIEKRKRLGIEVRPMTPAEIESAKWRLFELKNEGVFYSGLRSNFYGFSDKRPATV